MITWARGIVSGIGRPWPGVVHVDVRVTHADTDISPEVVPALAYCDLVGHPVVGDTVLLNTSAYQRGLGTGGFALVVALPDRLPEPSAGPGHLVKARYTPMQSMVLGVDDPESPHHEVLKDADCLEAMPVVAADLHSSLPAVLAGLRARHRSLGRGLEPRVAYVMTDGGALPAAFSASCAGLREAGWLHTVITTGQSYGGDYEAVTVHTGLLAARHVAGADVAVVTQGPGNLGTGTRWGFSGVALAEALNAVHVLGGRGIAALRVSAADARARHRGVSHHSYTAYGRVLNRPVDLAIPELTGCDGVSETFARDVLEQARTLVAAAPHLQPITLGCDQMQEAFSSLPVRLSTMGRGRSDDPAAFLAAAAAGWHAAELLA